MPSGPLGVRITRTPGGGGEGNTTAEVVPGGSLARTFLSLPLVLFSFEFFVLTVLWVSLILLACNLSCNRLRLEIK